MFFDHAVRTNYRDVFHRFFLLKKTTKKGYVFMTGSFFLGGGVGIKSLLLLHYQEGRGSTPWGGSAPPNPNLTSNFDTHKNVSDNFYFVYKYIP